MAEGEKKVLRIFVSHQNFDDCPSLEGAYQVVKDAIEDYNSSGLHRDKIEYEIQEYTGDRHLDNPRRGTYQSSVTLKDDAANAHAVVTLVDGDMSPRIRRWYEKQVGQVKKEKEEYQVPMPVYWNTGNEESKKKCKQFESDKDRDFIRKYESFEKLNRLIKDDLEQLSVRWARRIDYDRPIPTLESSRQRRNRRLLIGGLVLLAVAIAFYLLWPTIDSLLNCKREIGPSPQELFNERIDNAEAMVGKGETAALDTLNVLRDACLPEWTVEKRNIDSLMRIALAPTPYDDKSGKPVIIPTPVKFEGYELIATPVAFNTKISAGIDDFAKIRPCPTGKIPKYTISITEEVESNPPKMADYDSDVVYMTYTVEIKDNSTSGETYKNIVKSDGEKHGLDAAKNQARDKAVDGIIEIVKNGFDKFGI